MALPPHVLEFWSDDPVAGPTLDALYHAAPTSDAEPTLRYALRRTGADAFTATAPTRPAFGPAPLADCWAFLEWRAIEDVLNDPGPDQVFIHAAGVEIAGRLVLLVGPSGSGKSTLAAGLIARGYAALGDDVLRFAPMESQFLAVPRSLKLDGMALRSLSLRVKEISTASFGTFLAGDVWYVSPAALNARWEAPPGRPWGVVVLGSEPRSGEARLERFSEGQAAVQVVRSLLGARYGMGGEAAASAGLRLVECLGESVAFHARGRGATALADLIEEAARA